MNDDLFVKPPQQPDEPWETAVRDIARDFAYPATPDIARRTSQRLTKARRPAAGVLKWAVVILLALTVIVVSVPEARAFVVQIIRIGAIQIFVGQPTPTLIPTPKPSATRTASRPIALSIASALYMTNETTLEDAVAQLKSPILLPTQPEGIGQPDHVYVQHIDQGVLVTMVWLTPGQPDQVWLTLDILDDRLIANKFVNNDGQFHNVQVNKTSAQWLTGLHEIGFFGNNVQIFRKVNGSVLIWLVGQSPKLTYRLEGTLTVEEATRIAESMHDPGTP